MNTLFVRDQTLHQCESMNSLSETARSRPRFSRTAIAITISMAFAGQAVFASEADAPASLQSQSVPGAQNHREPLSTAMPRITRQTEGVVALALNMDRATVPADGKSPVKVELRLFDADGALVKTDQIITLEVSGGRIKLKDAQTDVQGPRGGDTDFEMPGTQIKVVDGQISFEVLAPDNPQEVVVRASTERLAADASISFVPELRDWIAVGLIEGVIALRRSSENGVSPVRANDGFEQELRQFERQFSSGRGQIATRAAFFVKGTIKGKYLLSAAYDSDKETRARMLRDIKPEEIYPIYGDSSIKGYEARSGSKLFVRVSRGKNYVLFGDFTTVASSPTAIVGDRGQALRRVDLGANNRTLTGGKIHLEGKRGQLDAYAVRDNLHQRVDEILPNGTSGPYGLNSNSAIENTERVELITRDRNQPGQIIAVRLLQRFVDYTFEPFAGRLLFKTPITRTDEFGNLHSIRVSYEQDSNDDSYWSAGVEASAKLTDNITVGGGISRNDIDTAVSANPEVTDLASVNVAVKLSEQTTVVAEVARSESIATNTTTGASQNTDGSAMRVEARTGSATGRWSASAHMGKTDTGFVNPSASMQQGRSEAGVRGQLNVTENIGVRGEIQQSKDETSNAKNKGAYLGLTVKASKRLVLSAGLRHVNDNGNGLVNPVSFGSNGSVYSGTGLDTAGGGLFGDGAGSINPTNGNPIGSGLLSGTSLSTNTLQLGASWQATKRLQLGAEVEKNYSGDEAWRAAARASWEFADRVKLNARYELQTGLGGYYDRNEQSRAIVLGVSRGFLENGETYAEYRLRDAQAGREAQLAHGLRNTFSIGNGWRALASLERVAILSGVNREATAVALGTDYPGGKLWKASARVEARRLHDNPATTPKDPADSYLVTASAARKLSRSWTGLTRIYSLHSDDQAIAGNQSQTRFQIGAAYRPVDTNRFDALGKLELRRERNSELAQRETRNVIVAAMHGNWHPSRPWWFSSRVAAKRVNETLAGTPDKYSAWLFGGRVIYDVTQRWDVGAMASLLGSPQGAARQWAFGLETGYTLRTNLWLSIGYNWRGFTDRDLTGSDYTAQGMFIRLRYKFDEDLFRGTNPNVNRARPREQ